MCTVLIGFKLFPSQPVVIAANRDEMLDREALPPQFRLRATTLTPLDVARGGTWIGVSERGVFAALTNRIDVTSVWDPKRPRLMKTRGELVQMALGHRTAAEAIADIAQLRTRAYNGYNLIVGDAEELFLARGGGVDGSEHPIVTRQPDEPGLLVVSNLGIGPAHSPRAEAIMDVWNRRRADFREQAPHRAVWDQLLTIHDPDPRSEPAWMRRMASTCIHRPDEENYGTRSSAFVVLQAARGLSPFKTHLAEWRYWHRERPAGTHACEGRWDRTLILPIIG